MSGNAVKARFLIFLLLLSFLILGVVHLPVSAVCSTQTSASSDTSPDGGSVSFIINSVPDCLEAENLSFQISAGQAMISKMPADEKCDYLMAVVFPAICMLLFFAFSAFEISIFRITYKIADFMHAKDGMT